MIGSIHRGDKGHEDTRFLGSRSTTNLRTGKCGVRGIFACGALGFDLRRGRRWVAAQVV